MKKLAFLIFLTTLISTCVKAQPAFTWAKQMGSASPDNGFCVLTDAAGNVYTTGFFQGTVDFDPGAGTLNLTSFGSNDIFVQKLNSSGNLVWAKQLGGISNDHGQSMQIDGSGNVYFTGGFNGTADFDPGAGTFNLTSFGGYDIYVCKLDASGNFVWAKQLGSSGDDRGWSLVLDASNNVYSTGWYNGTGDFDPSAGTFNMTSMGGTDIYISKLDVSGNFVWAKTIGSTAADVGYGIALDASSNVYTTGEFQNIADFDPGAGSFNMTSVGVEDIFISKLDASGSFVFAKQIGSATSDGGRSISIDGSGNIISTGYFSSTADFDPGAGTFNIGTYGLNDIFVSKLNSSGNFVWAKQLGGTLTDGSSSVIVDASNNIYTTGNFGGTADFDPGAGTYTFTSAGAADTFVSKLDPSGNFVYAFQIGGTNTDVGNSIFVDGLYNVYLTGRFDATVDFDPGAGIFNMTGAGITDIFVEKLCQIPKQPLTISGTSSLCFGSTSTYSIAVIAGATSYTWSLPGGWSGSSVTNTISATPGSSGIFSVTASNACGTSPQQTLNVTVNPQPTISVNSGSICSGNSFTIVPSGASTYTIQGGSAVVSPTANASYTVVGTSIAGCVSASSATSNITVNALPSINVSTTNTLLCVGQSATITASGASTYTFNPGGAGSSIVVSPTVTSTYTISGTNAQGCNNLSVFTQNVSSCTSLGQIPNPISEINIYPNPFHSKITIIPNGIKQTVQIFSVAGSSVYKNEIENEKIEIDLGKETLGIYFVRIGLEIKKIIKE